MSEHVYALTHYLNGNKQYFYVGRSTRSPEIRFKEHQYKSEFGTEDVYNYIRNNCVAQVFEQEILCECKEFNSDDYEDYYVIKLIREGHNLQNMKHGDAKSIALTNEINDLTVRSIQISTVGDLIEYRAGERARKLQEKILADKSDPKLRALLDSIPKVGKIKRSKKLLIAEADRLTEARKKR